MPELEIRPARAERIYVAIFCSVWCGLLASAGVRGAIARSVPALFTLPMLVFGAVLGYRLFRLEVRAERDRLIVRNYWTTRTLRRVDIEGFRTGAATVGLPSGQAVQVLLRDDTVLPLDVTRSSFPLPLPRGRARLQERLHQLQAWQSS